MVCISDLKLAHLHVNHEALPADNSTALLTKHRLFLPEIMLAQVSFFHMVLVYRFSILIYKAFSCRSLDALITSE